MNRDIEDRISSLELKLSLIGDAVVDIASSLKNSDISINDPDSYIGSDGVEVTKTVDSLGTIHWKNSQGLPHRIDGPAVIYSNGTEYWYKDDKFHREDGPAVTCYNGIKYWYKDGKHHRLDGPAVINPNGSEFWYKDGKLHRVDGPAIIRYDGKVEFYLNGKKVENVLVDNLWNKARK